MFKSTIIATSLALAASPVLAAERQFNLRGFDTIAADSNVKVGVQIGDEFTVTAQGNDSALRGLDLRTKGDTLYISNDSSHITWGLIDLLRRDEWVSVTVTLPKIEEIKAINAAVVTLAGGQGDELELKAAKAGEIHVSGIQFDEVEAEVSTGASMTIAGLCGELDAESSTGGQMDAQGLVCDHVSVESSTGSIISVNGTQTAKLKASTGAQVDLAGGANVLSSRSSMGGQIQF